jgi:hypothetical protein
VHVDFIAVFSLVAFVVASLPRFPAMSSVEDFFDPESPRAGEEFVKKLEIPPGLLPTASAFSSEEARVLGTQSAAFRRETKAAEVDAVFGKSALERWTDAQDELLEKVFGFSGTTVPPSPAEVYHRAWQHPAAGALMVAKVRRTKFDVSEPFLLLVHFPTVLSRGYTGPVFNEASPKARFAPGLGLVPEGGAMPFIGGVELDTRSLHGVQRDWMALREEVVVGFGPKSFSHIVVPWGDVAASEHALGFSDLYRSWDALRVGGLGSSESDIRVGSEPPQGPNCGGIRVPVLLPLAAPLCLPAGIIGKPSLGVNGIKMLLGNAYGKKKDFQKLVKWLNHPAVMAWITVATMYHKEMAVEVMGRQAILGSLQQDPVVVAPTDVYLANSLVADYWKAMELTLAFRYFIDFVLSKDNTSSLVAPFYHYVVNAAQRGLYDESNILGARPWEVAYEVLLLRPPKDGPGKRGRWNPLAAAAKWSVASSRCPDFLRNYVVVKVDPNNVERAPLKRLDGSKDPVFAAVPDESSGTGPAKDPFPATDERICNPEYDCGEFEQQERLLIDRWRASLETQEVDDDDLFPELQSGDPIVAEELKQWRLRPLAERHIARPIEPAAPAAPAVQKRPAGVDPFRFLLETAQKRKKQSGGGAQHGAQHAASGRCPRFGYQSTERASAFITSRPSAAQRGTSGGPAA